MLRVCPPTLLPTTDPDGTSRVQWNRNRAELMLDQRFLYRSKQAPDRVQFPAPPLKTPTNVGVFFVCASGWSGRSLS